MASRDDLTGLLEQLSNEGMLDSGGHFTLDSRKAWEKARGLRFSDPGQYLRCLYRGAVLGEATRVEFSVDSDDTTLSFDGPALTESQLRYLVGSLYVEETSWCSRKLQQLALGMHGAWSQGYVWAEIHSAETSFRYLPDRPEPQPVERKAARPGNYIHFKRPFGKKVIQRFFTHKFPEMDDVFGSLGHSHLETSYNGEVLRRQPCTQKQFRLDVDVPDSLRLLGPEPIHRLEISDCPISISLALDLLPHSAQSSFRLYVADVEIPREYSLPNCPGLSAVVSVGPMLLDASQLYPVENEDFRLLLSVLEEAWIQAVVLANRTPAGLASYRPLLRSISPKHRLYEEARDLYGADPGQRTRFERQVDFARARRRGQNLYIPICSDRRESLCLQRESRKILLGRQGRTVETQEMSSLVAVCQWEEQERIYLCFDFGLREFHLWQAVTPQNREQVEQIVRLCRGSLLK